MKNNYRNIFSRLSHLILEDGENKGSANSDGNGENTQQAAPEEEKDPVAKLRSLCLNKAVKRLPIKDDQAQIEELKKNLQARKLILYLDAEGQMKTVETDGWSEQDVINFRKQIKVGGSATDKEGNVVGSFFKDYYKALAKKIVGFKSSNLKFFEKLSAALGKALNLEADQQLQSQDDFYSALMTYTKRNKKVVYFVADKNASSPNDLLHKIDVGKFTQEMRNKRLERLDKLTPDVIKAAGGGQRELMAKYKKFCANITAKTVLQPEFWKNLDGKRDHVWPDNNSRRILAGCGVLLFRVNSPEEKFQVDSDAEKEALDSKFRTSCGPANGNPYFIHPYAIRRLLGDEGKFAEYDDYYKEKLSFVNNQIDAADKAIKDILDFTWQNEDLQAFYKKYPEIDQDFKYTGQKNLQIKSALAMQSFTPRRRGPSRWGF